MNHKRTICPINTHFCNSTGSHLSRNVICSMVYLVFKWVFLNATSNNNRIVWVLFYSLMAALANKGRPGLGVKIAWVETLAGKRASDSTQQTAVALTGTERASTRNFSEVLQGRATLMWAVCQCRGTQPQPPSSLKAGHLYSYFPHSFFNYWDFRYLSAETKRAFRFKPAASPGL